MPVSDTSIKLADVKKIIDGKQRIKFIGTKIAAQVLAVIGHAATPAEEHKLKLKLSNGLVIPNDIRVTGGNATKGIKYYGIPAEYLPSDMQSPSKPVKEKNMNTKAAALPKVIFIGIKDYCNYDAEAYETYDLVSQEGDLGQYLSRDNGQDTLVDVSNDDIIVYNDGNDNYPEFIQDLWDARQAAEAEAKAKAKAEAEAEAKKPQRMPKGDEPTKPQRKPVDVPVPSAPSNKGGIAPRKTEPKPVEGALKRLDLDANDIGIGAILEGGDAQELFKATVGELIADDADFKAAVAAALPNTDGLTFLDKEGGIKYDKTTGRLAMLVMFQVPEVQEEGGFGDDDGDGFGGDVPEPTCLADLDIEWEDIPDDQAENAHRLMESTDVYQLVKDCEKKPVPGAISKNGKLVLYGLSDDGLLVAYNLASNKVVKDKIKFISMFA